MISLRRSYVLCTVRTVLSLDDNFVSFYELIFNHGAPQVRRDKFVRGCARVDECAIHCSNRYDTVGVR